MSFALNKPSRLDGQLRRIARRELERAGEELAEDRTTKKTIHDARKRVKKVRAIVRLLDRVGADPGAKEKRWLRAAARALSTIRDKAVIVDSYDRLRHKFGKQFRAPDQPTIRHALVDAQKRTDERARRERRPARAAAALDDVRRRSKKWRIPRISFGDLVAAIEHTYRDSRKAMKRAVAKPGAAAIHEWRKRSKDLWYQLRLAQRLVTRLQPRIRALKTLERLLGEHHNLAILHAAVTREPRLRRAQRAKRELDAVTNAREAALAKKAFALGRRLHAEKPTRFAKRLRARRSRAAA